jgi:hypothetical protein
MRAMTKMKMARLPEQPGLLITRTRLLIALSRAAWIFTWSAIVVLRFFRMPRFGPRAAAARERIACLCKSQLRGAERRHGRERKNFRHRANACAANEFRKFNRNGDGLAHSRELRQKAKGTRLLLMSRTTINPRCLEALSRDAQRG